MIDFEALADIVSFGALLSFLAVCLCTMLGRKFPENFSSFSIFSRFSGRVVPPWIHHQQTSSEQPSETYGKPGMQEEPPRVAGEEGKAELNSPKVNLRCANEFPTSTTLSQRNTPHGLIFRGDFSFEFFSKKYFFQVATLIFGVLFLHNLVSIFFCLPFLIISLIAGIATARIVRTYLK